MQEIDEKKRPESFSKIIALLFRFGELRFVGFAIWEISLLCGDYLTNVTKRTERDISKSRDIY